MATVRRSLIAVCALLIGVSAAAQVPGWLPDSSPFAGGGHAVDALLDRSSVDDVLRDALPVVADVRATERQSPPDGRRRASSPWSYVGVAASALLLAVWYERTRRSRPSKAALLAYAHNASRAPPGSGLFVR
jgi:hypothetical protein